MAEDLKEDIQFGANTTGVEAGVNRVKRSLADLGQAAARTGRDAGTGLGAMGEGADRSSKKVESATRSMQASIQRLIAEQQAGSKSSREYWESLASQRGVNAAALRPLLDQLDAVRSKTVEAQTATASWRTELGKLAPLITAAFSATALYGFAGKLVAVQREFDVLNSSLITVTGSSEAAERELGWLKTFAKETPFGLAQATQAFVKMKSLGLDPTRAALTSFGNTASAMGKSLNQMIEAVADASSFQFERLRDFGITVKQEGEKVALTFQGVTTTIGKNAQEITAYLEGIGNKEFGGAMVQRAQTLDGAISELGDTWDELFRTINQQNAGALIYDSVTLANGAINDATTILRAMGEAADSSGKQFGALKTIQDGIATVFETVAVLGVNVAYVLTQVGNEIGGLAAQAAAAAQFNFAGVRAIREQMVADAEEARRQVDATTERILGARKAQEEYAKWATRNASAANDPRRVDLAAPKASPASGGDGGRKDTIDKEARAYESLTKTISEKIAQEREELASGEKLTESQKLRIRVEQELVGAHRASALALVDTLAAEEARNKAAADAMKTAQQIAAARKKEADGIDEWIRAQEQAAQKAVDSVKDRITSMKDEEEAIAMSRSLNISLAEAVELVTIARLEEKQAGFYEGSEGWNNLQREIKARRELLGLMGTKAAREANDRAAEDAARAWEKTSQTISDTLADYIMGGGKDAAQYLKRLFATLVLQPVVQMGVGSAMGALGLGSAGSSGGGGVMGAVQSASNINSLFGAGSQALFGASAGASMASLGYANAVGMIGGDAIGALAAANGMWAGVATGAQAAAQAAVAANAAAAAGTATALPAGTLAAAAGAPPAAGGIAGALGAIPGWGWALAGVGALFGGDIISGLFGRKLKDQGIEGTFGGETDFEGRTYQYYKGGLFRSNKTRYGELDEDLRSGLADQFGALQAGTSEMAKILGLGTDAIDNFTASIKISFNGLDEAGIQNALKAEFEKIAESLSSQTLGTTEFTRNGETAVQTLGRLSGSLSAVNGVFENLSQTLYASSLAGADMASQLVDLFGGADGFNSATGSYFQNFYSEDEQRAAMERQLQAALDKLDLTLPDIDAADARAQWRAQAEALDLTTEAGRKAWAVLIQLSGAFAGITQSAEDAAAAAAAAAAAQARQAEASRSKEQDLQIQLLRAQGNELAAVAIERQRELAALEQFGPAAQGIQRDIWAIIDAAAALQAGADAYFADVDRKAAEQGYVNDAQAAIDKMFGSVSAQAQAAAQAQASAAQAAAASWRSAASSIQSSLDRLREQTTAQMDPAARYAATKAEFDSLTIAALGGDSTAAGKLGSAADAFLEASKAGTATQAEYLRDRVLAEAKLASVLSTSEAQASLQESIAAAANASVSELQALNANLTGFAGALYEILGKGYQGADRGAAQTVAESFAKMQADYDAYFNDLAGFGKVGNKYTDASFNGASFTKLNNNMAAFTGADGIVSYIRAGESLVEVAKRIPELRALWEKNYGIKLPAFAEGGYHAGGLRVVGERGWEIEATGPARIWNQQQIAAAMRGGDNGSAQVVQALQTVSAQIERLEQRLAAIEDSNDQMATQQDSSTDGGNAQRAEIMNVKQLAQAIKEAMA
ncbi:tape measure protein [Paracidovorax wautersii]|uniref:Tape measure protein N-terminal domain-containing protein n=1 Tax=Paracidovorax wautersii TaxID=1177982 RepID=A0ABU1IGR5_9BURK|nr:tape measure protein [Paracidovorax wautersii]MDR6216156.1 hypothetical protein [Paracidovorax wautersii]